jgi:site-specific recombinase XerD
MKKPKAAGAWNKGKKFPAEPLSPNEVIQLLDQCSKRAPSGIRNRALLALLWRCGLRCSEALDLEPRDIDASTGLVRVRNGKGGKLRVVKVDSTALALVGHWLAKRTAFGLNGRHKLFPTLQGKPLNARYVRALVARLGRRAGIERRCHPHALRHSHASELAREGKPLHLISQQLGHSDLSTTSRYIAKLSPQELSDGLGDRQWE